MGAPDRNYCDMSGQGETLQKPAVQCCIQNMKKDRGECSYSDGHGDADIHVSTKLIAVDLLAWSSRTSRAAAHHVIVPTKYAVISIVERDTLLIQYSRC